MTNNLVKRIFLGIALLTLFDAVFPQIITLGGRNFIDHFRMIMNLLALVIFFIASVILVLNYKKVTRNHFEIPYLLLAIISWVYLSHLWTFNLYATFEASVLLTFTILFTLYAYTNFSHKLFFNCLYNISLFIVICSILLVFIIPSIGKMPEGFHAGDWRGVFLHKNGLGNYVALINVIFLCSIRNSYKFNVSLLGYILSLLLVIGSGSKTALASVIFIHIILYLIVLIRNKIFSFKLTLSFISLPIIFIVLYVFNYYDQIANLLGGDANLTGRIPLWFHVFQAISEKPLFGYGYGAFWGYDYGSVKFMDAMIWESGKSHNAFLDIWLDLGLVGAIMFIIFLSNILVRLVKKYRISKDIYTECYLLITIMLISVSLIDFRILYYNSIILFFVIYIYMYSIKNMINPKRLEVDKLNIL